MFIVVRMYNNKIDGLEKANKFQHNKIIQYKYDIETMKEFKKDLSSVVFYYSDCIDYMILDSNCIVSDSAMIMINESKNKLIDIKVKNERFNDSLVHTYESYLKP